MLKIAILGGTGKEGSGLAFRWAAKGHEVLIGSRSAERAQAAAEEMKADLPAAAISGGDNATVSEAADLIVLSIPYSAQEKTLEAIKDAVSGKLVVTVGVPLKPPKVGRVWRLPSGLSAAEEAQQQLGDSVRVVAAFQNISAVHLKDLDFEIDCDVLICGDKKGDKEVVVQLCEDAGMRGINAGALVNASAVEGLTAVLISINKINKVKSSGIRITGI